MALPAKIAVARTGHIINIGDSCSVAGTITGLADGTSANNVVVTILLDSGSSVNVKSSDIAASTQTL